VLVVVYEGIVYQDLRALEIEIEGHLLHSFREQSLPNTVLTGRFAEQQQEATASSTCNFAAERTGANSDILKKINS
jgi:hypothetical protein